MGREQPAQLIPFETEYAPRGPHVQRFMRAALHESPLFFRTESDGVCMLQPYGLGPTPNRTIAQEERYTLEGADS